MHIKNEKDLKEAIRQLEIKKGHEWLLLKEQLHVTADSFKPSNLIKNSFKEVASSGMKTNLVNSAIGMATGFVAKRVLLGSTNNFFTKMIGSLIEMAVANKVTKNSDGVRSIGKMIFEKLVHRNDDKEVDASAL